MNMIIVWIAKKKKYWRFPKWRHLKEKVQNFPKKITCFR